LWILFLIVFPVLSRTIFQRKDRYLAETTQTNPPDQTDPGQVMPWKGYFHLTAIETRVNPFGGVVAGRVNRPHWCFRKRFILVGHRRHASGPLRVTE
jgi:hypothetical protein